MKIGILYCAYNCAEYLEKSLYPWIEVKEKHALGHNYIISAVSVPFEEYRDIVLTPDDTTEKLKFLADSGKIDNLVSEPKYVKEHIARNSALQFLLKADVDYVILWDGDECPQVKQLEAIIAFALRDSYITWFAVSYKNFVFDEKTFMVEPFMPPRIFKVFSNGYRLKEFYWDNDIHYVENTGDQFKVITEGKTDAQLFAKSELFEEKKSYKNMSSATIPDGVAWINHYSWIDNDKTKAKVEYQNKHFQGRCSFSVNKSSNKLEFNEIYYRSLGRFSPLVSKE